MSGEDLFLSGGEQAQGEGRHGCAEINDVANHALDPRHGRETADVRDIGRLGGPRGDRAGAGRDDLGQAGERDGGPAGAIGQQLF